MSQRYRSFLARWSLLALLLAALPLNAENVGDEMYREFEKAGAFYDDPELQAYVERIGRRLLSHSSMPDKPFTFSVIDSPDINAFATPGYYVYVNRGLIAYMNSEAELAGVLGHEIAHITASHHRRQNTANITNRILATTAFILTGSSDVATAATMYGAEISSGFGREHELEADELGAQYMHAAGYDVEALLAVIGVLKNQEQFQRLKAREQGKPTGTYHGLYATHPRNDKRLQTVIRAANELGSDEYIENPEIPGEFQSHVNGLVWGDSVQNNRADDRYYHNKLGFTFEKPEGWTVDAGGSSVVAKAPDGSASVKITLMRRSNNTTPKSVLESGAGGSLSDGRDLEQSGLVGYTAVAAGSGSSARLGVIEFNGLYYLFDGKAGNFAGTDADLLKVIESFRPMHPKEKQAGTPRYVQYIQVPRGATLASLAAGIPIPNAEERLRLINDFYPRGEPRTGDWIKIIR
ncbi:MAG: M48 family metalloprotease [Pseudomonadota bacterium]